MAPYVPLFLDKLCYDVELEYVQEFTQFYILNHGGDDVVLDVTLDLHRDIPPAFANDYELKHTSHCMDIVNGVIGLQWGSTCLAFWNPATREFKDVPRWPIIQDNKHAEKFGGKILGLGFDMPSQDLMILGLIDFDGVGIEPNVYEYHLYSLKANSWKKVKEAPRSLLDVHHSVRDGYFNNGVYYWLANDKANKDTLVILAFNFSTKLFTELEVPKADDIEHMGSEDGRVWYDYRFSLTLRKYNETLALFTLETREKSDSYVELWAVTT